MTQAGRDDYRGRGNIGAEDDVLFGDPLNVRGNCHNSARNPPDSPRRPSPGPRSERCPDAPAPSPALRGNIPSTTTRQYPDPPSEAEEDWGPIGNFLFWVVAGGKQCCSMRDRTKPADIEAKARLVGHNRPPASRFPPPEDARRGLDSFKPAENSRSRQRDIETRSGGDRDSIFSTHQDIDGRDGGGYPGSGWSGTGRSNQPGGGFPGGSGRFHGRSAATEDMPGDAQYGRDARQDQGYQRTGGSPGADERDQLPPVRIGDEGIGGDNRCQDQSQLPPTRIGGDGLGGDNRAQGLSASSFSSRALARRWEWPTWCLNFRQPCIEVYVVDEDTGTGRWVNAEPQSRVVDKSGRDAYLCAEYQWDGEYYVQDFGPQHVRRRCQKETVFQQFEQTAEQSGETSDDLDSTRLAPGRTRPAQDNGGGVSQFLHN